MTDGKGKFDVRMIQEMGQRHVYKFSKAALEDFFGLNYVGWPRG